MLFRWLSVLIAMSAAAGCATTSQPTSARPDAPLNAAHFAGKANPLFDTPPRLIKGRAPVYPISLQLANQSGTITLEYTIGADGRTRDFEVKQAPDVKFANHAILAMKEWIFEPATKDGIPIETRLTQDVTFNAR